MKKSQFKAAVVCALAVGLAGYGYMPSPHQKLPSPRDLMPRKGLRIRPAEATHVKFVKYVDPSGFFTMNIPLGWRVKTGLKPDGKFDIISYAITVYDPKRPERELYFCLNNSYGLKSVEARNWYIQSYGPKNPSARMPVLPRLSTDGYFAAMGPLFGYRKFSVLERLGKSALGGDVIVAECTSASGRRVQGLYHAVVSGMMKQPVQVNPFNARAGMVDVGPVLEFSILSETAPKEEFVDWLPVLDRCFASIVFTPAFHQQRRVAWTRVMGTSKYIMQTADSIRGMIMDSFRRRNATYDVLSQKRSDATLGYERVRDTETGEIYRAENGFTDWYKGTRYRPATSNAAYLTPVSGYINWK